MPLTTRMFNWHDKEFRLADEVFVGIVVALTALMVAGAFILL